VLAKGSLLALLGCLVVVCSFSGQPERFKVAAADPPAELKFADVQALLAAHCSKCHGDEKPKGKFKLSALGDEKSLARQRKLWAKVLGQIESQDMPPPKEPPIAADRRDRLVRWLKQAANTIDCSDLTQRDPGPSAVRRLNRTEYDRTIRDLVGIDFDSGAAVGMADDRTGAGFDNLANGLTLSPALLEKYFAAADKLLEQVLGAADGSPSKEPPHRKQQAEKARAALLFVKPAGDISKRDAARRIVSRFARRAYRRPLRDGEADRLLKLFDLVQSRGDTFENGIRLTFKAVLVSPYFLVRVEEDRADKKPGEAYPISDHELAVRLSYFLWSSMPDDVLFELAEQQKLSDPAVLEQQVRRMLSDPKARALTDNFAVQWLQLHKLAEARPSTEFFPTFTHSLRQAMRDETLTFFDKLRADDESILRLLDADYTYVNQELAKHYGIDGVQGGQMRRVALQAENHRGGLLGMASILTQTSHTSRTSPTLRGKWVLDVVFGTPPPPPPPDAGMIKEEKQKGTPKSFRELLAMHASNATCAGCHKKMDPLGFALDSYDAIGRWRTGSAEQPLDTSGQLPTGEKFNGPTELKTLIGQRRGEFVRNLTEQLLLYALGRELQYYDDCTVREVTAALDKGEHRFSTLMQGIVKSYPFRHRRNLDAGGEE
jgi:cytochrome c553